MKKLQEWVVFTAWYMLTFCWKETLTVLWRRKRQWYGLKNGAVFFFLPWTWRRQLDEVFMISLWSNRFNVAHPTVQKVHWEEVGNLKGSDFGTAENGQHIRRFCFDVIPLDWLVPGRKNCVLEGWDKCSNIRKFKTPKRNIQRLLTTRDIAWKDLYLWVDWDLGTVCRRDIWFELSTACCHFWIPICNGRWLTTNWLTKKRIPVYEHSRQGERSLGSEKCNLHLQKVTKRFGCHNLLHEVRESLLIDQGMSEQ